MNLERERISSGKQAFYQKKDYTKAIIRIFYSKHCKKLYKINVDSQLAPDSQKQNIRLQKEVGAHKNQPSNVKANVLPTLLHRSRFLFQKSCSALTVTS